MNSDSSLFPERKMRKQYKMMTRHQEPETCQRETTHSFFFWKMILVFRIQATSRGSEAVTRRFSLILDECIFLLFCWLLWLYNVVFFHEI